MIHKFRCSSLGLIMTDAQSIDPSLLDEDTLVISKKKVKTDEDKAILAPLWDRSLSAGAKTYIESLAAQEVYGYDKTISSKPIEKGLMVEDQSIELLNGVLFTNFTKNKERKTNDWITGECDVRDDHRIIDIKSSWSLDTFPKLIKHGMDTGYEWQGRGYMMLEDKPGFAIAYCLVDTPVELIGYEDETLHYVSHIQPELRVTMVPYKRDLALEEKIKIKCQAGNDYLQKVIRTIVQEHAY
jgi:hypothetical protein